MLVLTYGAEVMTNQEQKNFNWKEWVTLIGLFIGVVGIIASYSYYQWSKREKNPVFCKEPTKKIEGDKLLVRFAFWNKGRMSINQDDIEEPLIIALDDPSGKIIDYSILKTSREIVDPVLLRQVDNETELELYFYLLEKNDGLSGQIIFQGYPESGLNITGIIRGAKNRKIEKKEANISLRERTGRTEFFLTLWVILSVVLAISIVRLSIDRKKSQRKEQQISR